MKPLIINNKQTQYLISPNGDIQNIKTYKSLFGENSIRLNDYPRGVRLKLI